MFWRKHEVSGYTRSIILRGNLLGGVAGRAAGGTLLSNVTPA